MVFDRMFTTAPQCVPSRAGYMTGRSTVAVRNTRFSSPLPPDEVTFPEVLREAGYFTGVCGRGFHLDGAGALGPITKNLMDKLNLRTWDRRVDYLDRGSPQEKVVGHVETFLDKAPQGKPFFMWANSDPHHAWNTKIEGTRHDPAAIKLPPHLPDLPGVRADLARYMDEITHCDRLFADLVALLKRRGLEQNTLVMFCGDNGMAFPHGKGSLYDPEGIRADRRAARLCLQRICLELCLVSSAIRQDRGPLRAKMGSHVRHPVVERVYGSDRPGACEVEHRRAVVDCSAILSGSGRGGDVSNRESAGRQLDPDA
jgi:arylsulfatase A-like enzyme